MYTTFSLLLLLSLLSVLLLSLVSVKFCPSLGSARTCVYPPVYQHLGLHTDCYYYSLPAWMAVRYSLLQNISVFVFFFFLLCIKLPTTNHFDRVLLLLRGAVKLAEEFSHCRFQSLRVMLSVPVNEFYSERYRRFWLALFTFDIVSQNAQWNPLSFIVYLCNIQPLFIICLLYTSRCV